MSGPIPSVSDSQFPQSLCKLAGLCGARPCHFSGRQAGGRRPIYGHFLLDRTGPAARQAKEGFGSEGRSLGSGGRREALQAGISSSPMGLSLVVPARGISEVGQSRAGARAGRPKRQRECGGSAGQGSWAQHRERRPSRPGAGSGSGSELAGGVAGTSTSNDFLIRARLQTPRPRHHSRLEGVARGVEHALQP